MGSSTVIILGTHTDSEGHVTCDENLGLVHEASYKQLIITLAEFEAL